MELGVKIIFKGTTDADYTIIEDGNEDAALITLSRRNTDGEADQHLIRLALENIIAATAPTFYGRWVDESYTAYHSAAVGEAFELVLTATDYDHGKVISNFVVMAASKTATSQMKTYGDVSDEAKLMKKLATYANNMGMLILKDHTGENYQSISNNGIKVGTDFKQMLLDLLEVATTIFIPSTIEAMNPDDEIADIMDEWYAEHKDRPCPVEVIF